VVAASLVALSLVSAGGHSDTYLGHSDQGFPVRAVLRQGAIDRIRVKWAAPCQTPGYVWGPQATVWFNRKPAPFKVAGGRYSDHGTVKFPFRDGRGLMRQRLSGRFSAESISGVQSSTVRVYDGDDKLLDSCSSRTRFHAEPAAPMQGLVEPLVPTLPAVPAH
jgi:hypothetical protein